MTSMAASTRTTRSIGQRRRMTQAIGRGLSHFQETSERFDEVAAEILALDRADLPVMTQLLFNGPASADELSAALQIRRPIVRARLERLQLAGYARYQPGAGQRIELTAHVREWIERIWAPLRQEGFRILDRYSTPHLTVIAGFLQQACAIQESHTSRLRAWLEQPSAARRPHLKGGLSPAALQRVQMFIESNLAGTIHLQDLAARAALSPYHFARAFRTSVGVTPRAFVEQRRVEHAKRLLRESTQPIATIAVDTGFGTQSRLTTVFKRRTGFTPAAYRRGHA
jgi:AraC family transcriptional regulator